MRNILGWLLLIFIVALLLFTGDKVQERVSKARRFRRLKKEYDKLNREYVKRYKLQRKLDALARAKFNGWLYTLILLELMMFAIFDAKTVAFTSSITISAVLIWSGTPFSKTRLADRLLAWFQGREYNRQSFNPQLVAVYARKRDEKRQEVMQAIGDLRRS